MLSIGWPEMMVVAAAALIIIGPRDLPAMLRRLGQAAGSVRRMSNEFRAEINKVAALDDVKNAKDSLSLPFTKAQADITKEFNKITPTGVEPSGALTPKDPKAESVFDEIQSVAGKPAKGAAKTGKTAAGKTAKAAKSTNTKSRAAKTATGKKPATRKAAVPAKAKATPVKTKPATIKAKPAAKKPVAKKTVAKKPAAAKTPRKRRATKVS